MIDTTDKYIRFFKGMHFYLSNFYPIKILYEGIEYPTVEHAFQAAKTLDTDMRIHISKLQSAGEAKRVGRQSVEFRPGWANIRLSIMETLLRIKFSDQHLMDLLISTRPAHIEECNSWGDEYWGVYIGRGENHLGKLLMQIRDE